MATRTSRPTHARAPKPMSRRRLLTQAAGMTGGAAALLASGAALDAQAVQAPAIATGTQAGRRYRALVHSTTRPTITDVRMLALDENRVVVRTEATQLCYTIVNQSAQQYPIPRILGHGGVGIVEAIGSKVRRVQVGDRVIVANTPQCGVCYTCLRGRPDRCQMLPGNGNTMLPIGTLPDGTQVVQHNNEGGFGELMIPYEWYCMPITYDVSPIDLSVLGCPGACGLGCTFGVAPVEVASDVVVMGCGPVGLSAVQGARIKGASQIIAVEPIRARREAALRLGATLALDPNVEGNNLVARVKDLCKPPISRFFAGGGYSPGMGAGPMGPDFVIEAVGGDAFPPKAEAGPDPTGILPLQQAWQMLSAAGHLMTVSVGHRGNFTLPGGQWSNGAKNHHPGNFNGVHSLRDMPRFARLISTGQYNARALATTIAPFERTLDALQEVSDRTTVGAVVTFS
jgi:S-(hydroxymethyl)glutathione dehydrogenase / alcohol dehydrogenase